MCVFNWPGNWPLHTDTQPQQASVHINLGPVSTIICGAHETAVSKVVGLPILLNVWTFHVRSNRDGSS